MSPDEVVKVKIWIDPHEVMNLEIHHRADPVAVVHDYCVRAYENEWSDSQIVYLQTEHQVAPRRFMVSVQRQITFDVSENR